MEDHDKQRRKLCLICCSSANRPIPDSLIETIRDLLVPGYDPDYPRLPGGLCQSCRLGISSMKSGNFNRCVPEWYDYSPMMSYRFPRDGSKCDCILCQRAKTKFGVKGTKKRKPGERIKLNGNEIVQLLCTKCLRPRPANQEHRCSQTSIKTAAENLKLTMSDSNRKRLAYELIKEELRGRCLKFFIRNYYL